MLGAAMVAASVTSASASAFTIDFSSLSPGPISSYDGLTFSVSGGPGDSGAPVIGYGYYGDVLSLNNSVNWGSGTSGYPTGSTLDIVFPNLVSDLSFTFNNYGSSIGTFYKARDSADVVISTAVIDSVNNFATVIVSGTGIKTLEINNNTGGGFSWIFGVGSISGVAAPEPSTWAMMGLGFVGLAFAGYRTRRTTISMV
jgi:hypothetical protein